MKKYYIISLNIRDGEYEYLCQSPVCLQKNDDAKGWAKEFLGASRMKEISDNSFEEINGYRIVELDRCVEISKEEYDIINKYIY